MPWASPLCHAEGRAELPFDSCRARLYLAALEAQGYSMKPGGIFDLRSPLDMLKKAIHDIERLRNNPLDTYAAFDFFVTARHIPDWLRRTELFNHHIELRVCRHLGDSSKHPILTHKLHKQVQHSERRQGAWGEAWRQAWGDSWGENKLVVVLDTEDPDTSQLGTEIDALDLAEKVLAILKREVPE